MGLYPGAPRTPCSAVLDLNQSSPLPRMNNLLKLHAEEGGPIEGQLNQTTTMTPGFHETMIPSTLVSV